MGILFGLAVAVVIILAIVMTILISLPTGVLRDFEAFIKGKKSDRLSEDKARRR